MKKLMFIAVAALAFCANAANCSWEVDTIFDPSTGSGSTGFLVYFFDADLAGSSTADAQAALNSKNVTTINEFLTKGWQGDDTDDGYSSGATPSGSYGNSQDVNGYLVVFNAGNVADADYGFISGIETATTGPLGQAASIGFGDLDDSATLSNWTQISSGGGGIPEPTSGLLLLVGGAMLALRRKRA